MSQHGGSDDGDRSWGDRSWGDRSWGAPDGERPDGPPADGTRPVPERPGTQPLPEYPYGPGPYGGPQPPYGAPGGYGGQPPPPYGAPGGGQQPPYGAPGGGQPPPYGAPGGYGGQQPPAYGPPGYGQQYGQPQQGQWHNLPPEDLVRMHQPGIIPLRPLNLGQIFEGSLKTMRRNPEATIGMAVLVLAVMMVPSLIVSLLLPRLLPAMSRMDLELLAGQVPSLMSGLATLALSGFIIYVVSEAALGDRVTIGQTWAAVRGRLWALVGISLLSIIGIATIVIGIVLIGALTTLALGVVGALLLIVLMLGMIPLVLWLYARIALGPAAVVLEKAGPITGLKRAWTLTTGAQSWRVLGILLLASIVASIFAAIIAGLLAALLLAAFSALTSDTEIAYTLTVVIEHLAQFIIGALTTPFTAGVVALLYLDQRIRREGLDINLVKAAQERAAARRTH